MQEVEKMAIRYKTHDKPTQEMINKCNIYLKMEDLPKCAKRLIGNLLDPKRRRSHSANENTMGLIEDDIAGINNNPMYRGHC